MQKQKKAKGARTFFSHAAREHVGRLSIATHV